MVEYQISCFRYDKIFCDEVGRLKEVSAPTHKGKEHKLTHMGNILLALPGA